MKYEDIFGPVWGLKLPFGGYWYLATPYSKYPEGLKAAARDASILAGKLIKAGVPIYSPIAHTHPIAMEAHMDPLDHGIWLQADKPLMESAYGLIVAKMDTWDLSYGISEEIKVFEKVRKPIVYLTIEEGDLIP